MHGGQGELPRGLGGVKSCKFLAGGAPIRPLLAEIPKDKEGAITGVLPASSNSWFPGVLLAHRAGPAAMDICGCTATAGAAIPRGLGAIRAHVSLGVQREDTWPGGERGPCAAGSLAQA